MSRDGCMIFAAMGTQQFETAVRVLDAICECIDPASEDVATLRSLAETDEERLLPINELACVIIVRERRRQQVEILGQKRRPDLA
jgi:hypothetical protein